MLNKRAGLIIFIFDVVALYAALILSAFVAEYISVEILGNDYISLFSVQSYVGLIPFIPLSCIVLAAMHNRGHYVRRIPLWNQVRYILIILMAMFCLEGFVFFAIKYPFSRLWITLSWLFAFFLLLIGRTISRKISIWQGVWFMPTTVIGNGSNMVETLYALFSEKYMGYDVQSLIVDDEEFEINQDELPLEYKDVRLERVPDIVGFIKSAQDRFLIIAYDSYKNIDEIIETLNSNNIQYVVVPPLKGMPLYGAAPQYFFGHDIIFLHTRQQIFSPVGRFIKRALDITGSVIALIIGAPFLLIIIYLIKKDGGGVVFAHNRIGKNGEIFPCYKFRTMVPDAGKVLEDLLKNDPEAKKEWDVDFKLKNDPRITKIGNFLRKSSIDELPQIINVLKGQMSLVGPRPIVEGEKKYYGEDIKDYMSVKPGITGLWQVSGRNDTGYQYRVYLDKWYVNNWSVWHDVVIIFKTIGVLLSGRGAY